MESFGRTDGVYRADRPWMMARAVTSGTQHLWALQFNSYIIEKFNAQWQRVGALKVGSPWFEEWNDYPAGVPHRVPPPPEMTGIWEGNDGMLWVVSMIPSETWSQRSAEEGEFRFDVAALDPFYDTMIEVIDPNAERVVTRRRFRGRIVPTGQPGWLFRVKYSESNDIVYEVFEVRVGPP